MAASAEVIAARTALMVKGLTDPAGQDQVELSLMSSEKTQAMAASAGALAANAGAMGERLGRDALDEGARAMRAATEVAGARTPAEAAQAQFRYAMGWWSRAAGQALTLNGELTKAQTEALTPIHKTAVANATRLRKR
ncbi:MAG: phasin [Brevundimonas sp.]